jgi:AcrR family transcriptional regulator
MASIFGQRDAVKARAEDVFVKTSSRGGQTRVPLTRERVLRAAIDVADLEGIEAITMRRLGHELGVEAMALYRYVANKVDVLDGMVDLLLSDISLPSGAGDWKAAIRRRAMAARKVVRQHRWAPRLITSRQAMGPSTLRLLEAVTADLRDGGFSHELGHHAMHVLGARLWGFTQEPFNEGELSPEVTRAFLRQVREGHYPAIAAALSDAHHDDDLEFEFGLELILNGLERARKRPARTESHRTSPQ